MSNDPSSSTSESIATSKGSPDPEKVPEIFKRHIGTWQGEYIKTDSRGHFLRSF